MGIPDSFSLGLRFSDSDLRSEARNVANAPHPKSASQNEDLAVVQKRAARNPDTPANIHTARPVAPIVTIPRVLKPSRTTFADRYGRNGLSTSRMRGASTMSIAIPTRWQARESAGVVHPIYRAVTRDCELRDLKGRTPISIGGREERDGLIHVNEREAWEELSQGYLGRLPSNLWVAVEGRRKEPVFDPQGTACKDVEVRDLVCPQRHRREISRR